MIGRLVEALTFQAGYNAASAMLGVTLLGAAAGVVGTFLVLRRRALLGDALAHATLPGIVLAFLAGGVLGIEGRSLPLLLAGGALSGLLGLALVTLLARRTRLSEDAAIGAVLSVTFAFGVVLLSYVQTMSSGGQAGLKTFIFGQAAAITRDEAIGIALVALGAVGTVMILFRGFAALAFDETHAASLGLPVRRLDFLIAGLAAVVALAGLQAAGLVLVVALLIIPPVAARLWTERLPRVTLLAAAIGAFSGGAGAALSYAGENLPTGATIVLTAGAVAVFSLFFAPRRGVLANALNRGTYRTRLERMRWLARTSDGDDSARRLSLPTRVLLRLEGLTGAQGRPTAKALARAPAAHRNVLLWQAALALPPDTLPPHVRFGVDEADRVLPADVLARLEKGIAR